MKSKIEFIAHLLIVAVLGGGVALLGFKYLFPAIAPFIIAWGIALGVKGVSEKISEKTNISVRLVRLVLALGTIVAVFALGFFGIWRISAALWRFVTNIGEDGFYKILRAITDIPLLSNVGIAPEIMGKIEDAAGDMLAKVLTFAAGAVTSWISAVPRVLFFLLIAVIALVYFALDLERINRSIASLIPQKYMQKLISLKSKFVTVCKKYISSYILLLFITFCMMLAGMLILGVGDAVIIAVIMSVLDFLPILGVGAVLVPWSAVCFMGGNTPLGIGLCVLFVINTVVRQLIEPKILGKRLNMHPLVTLILLYAGYSVLGLLGILLVPIFAIAIGVLTEEKSVSQ